MNEGPKVTAETLATFIVRALDGRYTSADWQHFMVAPYPDREMEAARRQCVQLITFQHDGDPKQLTEDETQHLRTTAAALAIKPERPLEGSSLTLSADESLVLFDLLSRLIDDENTSALFELVQHDAEIWALNSLHCQLERSVSASFTAAYRSSVHAARSDVLALNGGQWPSRQTKS